VWGDVWLCLGFDWWMCSCIMLIVLVLFGYYDELVLYLCGVLCNGLIWDEISEVFL